ncbi:MAG: BACON domain-containing protein [Bryobacteraceae bacterium]
MARRVGAWIGIVFAGFGLWTAAAQPPLITTVAGTEWSFPFEPRRALDAPIGGLLGMGLAADGEGNFYVADPDNNVVMKIDREGVLRVFAGNGLSIYSGDGGLATEAGLVIPIDVSTAPDGSVYILDQLNLVRRVDPDGTITTVAGDILSGYSGDGGTARNARFHQPWSLAVDSVGNIFVCDRGNHRVRRIGTDGIITTIAGNGSDTPNATRGVATEVALVDPLGIAVDRQGNVYIADQGLYVVWRVRPDGEIEIAAGGGRSLSNAIPATAAALFPVDVAVDANGNLLIADWLQYRVARVDAQGVISTVAGNGNVGVSGDGGPATSASLIRPSAIAASPLGEVFIGDGETSKIRRVNTAGIIETVAGNGRFREGGDGGPATQAFLYLPSSLATDSNGNVYAVEQLKYRVRRIRADGLITTFAGTGSDGYSGDGGPAVNARLSFPSGVAVDAANNVYIADTLNHRIRRVSPAGIITTVAGNGTGESLGDGGPALQASIYAPYDIAFDRNGEMYVTEVFGHRVRRIDRNGRITTVAGNGQAGYSGDGGAATAASLNEPRGLAVDALGAVYVADYKNNRVRRIGPDRVIRTAAGTGERGLSGDGGPAAQARLNRPSDVAIDPAGNLVIADELNHRVRLVNFVGVISTVAGSSAGFSGDGGPAIQAQFAGATAIASFGPDLFVSDFLNHRVRRLLSQRPPFTTSPGSLSFTSVVDGEAPARRLIEINGLRGLDFRATVQTTSGGPWLRAGTLDGVAPAVVEVTVDPKDLTPGTYNGRITITAPNANPPVRTVEVSLRITPPPPPQLSVRPESLSLSLNARGAPSSQSLTIANSGGGRLIFGAGAETRTGGAWLRLSATTGAATASRPGSLIVTADPASLGPGTYTGVITVVGADTRRVVAVTLTVSGVPQSLELAPSALSFVAVANGGRPPRQSFGVRNLRPGEMAWEARAETLSGGSQWLAVERSSGVSRGDSPDAPEADVVINAEGLSAGQYFGQIRVSAPGADNSPQFVSVALNVLGAGSNPAPVVLPSALLFTAPAGGVSPSSQTVLVSNLTSSPLNFTAGRFTREGIEWFVSVPTDAVATPDRTSRIVVQPDVSGLAAGVYRGTLTLVFAGNVTRSVDLVFIVTPGETTSARATRTAEAPCAPSRLIPVFASLPDNFRVPAAWPQPLEARVLDNCGKPLAQGSAVVSFSNGDAPLTLRPLRDGRWTGTWQVGNRPAAGITLRLSAESPDRQLTGGAVLSGDSETALPNPVIQPGGVQSTISLQRDEPLAPGSLISIFGTNLADGAAASSAFPWPGLLAATRVLFAGLPAPLVRVTPERIDAMLPYDVAVNTRHQLIVVRGQSLTVPESLAVAAAQPAIFTQSGTGSGQGLIYTIGADGSRTLAEPGRGATAGSRLGILCAGLGAVDPQLAAGSAAPSPAPNVTGGITVWIAGLEAKVLSAALAAGESGRYWVEVEMPSVASGVEVGVQMQASGQLSAPVTMAVE